MIRKRKQLFLLAMLFGATLMLIIRSLSRDEGNDSLGEIDEPKVVGADAPQARSIHEDEESPMMSPGGGDWATAESTVHRPLLQNRDWSLHLPAVMERPSEPPGVNGYMFRHLYRSLNMSLPATTTRWKHVSEVAPMIPWEEFHQIPRRRGGITRDKSETRLPLIFPSCAEDPTKMEALYFDWAKSPDEDNVKTRSMVVGESGPTNNKKRRLPCGPRSTIFNVRIHTRTKKRPVPMMRKKAKPRHRDGSVGSKKMSEMFKVRHPYLWLMPPELAEMKENTGSAKGSGIMVHPWYLRSLTSSEKRKLVAAAGYSRDLDSTIGSEETSLLAKYSSTQQQKNRHLLFQADTVDPLGSRRDGDPPIELEFRVGTEGPRELSRFAAWNLSQKLSWNPKGNTSTQPHRKFKYGIWFDRFRCPGNVYHSFFDAVVGGLEVVARRGWEGELNQIAFFFDIPGGGVSNSGRGCPGFARLVPYGLDDKTIFGYAFKRVFNINQDDLFERVFVVGELSNRPKSGSGAFGDGYKVQHWQGVIDVGELGFPTTFCNGPLEPRGVTGTLMNQEALEYSVASDGLRSPYYRAFDNTRYGPVCMHITQTIVDKLSYHIDKELGAIPKDEEIWKIYFVHRLHAHLRNITNQPSVLQELEDILELERRTHQFSPSRKQDTSPHLEREGSTEAFPTPAPAAVVRTPGGRKLDLYMNSTSFSSPLEAQNYRLREFSRTGILIIARGAATVNAMMLPPGSVMITLTPFFSPTPGPSFVNETTGETFWWMNATAPRPNQRIQRDSFPWLAQGHFLEGVTHLFMNCEAVDCVKGMLVDDGGWSGKWKLTNSCAMKCVPGQVANALRMALDITFDRNKEKWGPKLKEGPLGSRYYLPETYLDPVDGYEYYKGGDVAEKLFSFDY